MARSKLLTDLLSSNVDLESIFLRLKVILSDLNYDPVMKWIDGELKGYTDIKTLPSYRIAEGYPTGTFLTGGGRAKHSNTGVPIESLVDEEQVKAIKTVSFKYGISVIQNMLITQDAHIRKEISAAYYHRISKPELQIVHMEVRVPLEFVRNVVSNVKSKLVEIVMELEKDFEDIDELDIKPQLENQDVETIIYNIENILHDSIQIGDENKFNKSKLGHDSGEEK